LKALTRDAEFKWQLKYSCAPAEYAAAANCCKNVPPTTCQGYQGEPRTAQEARRGQKGQGSFFVIVTVPQTFGHYGAILGWLELNLTA
jgi:hypothetical protein